jgi:hypothetical protein
VEQAYQTDLTCTLELPGGSCNSSFVYEQGGTTVDLINTYDGPAITTCLSVEGGIGSTCREFANWEPDVFETGHQPVVYLEHKMSETSARVRADYVPGFHYVANSTQTVNLSSYVLEIIADDDVTGIRDTNENTSGLVRIERPLSRYFETLSFCWNKPDIWAEYVNAVSMQALYSMTPCKTYQKDRDNFVFLHATNVSTDMELKYRTVLAIYKTPAGRDRIADVQNGNNLLLVTFSIDASLFNSDDIQDIVPPVIYDFTAKAYSHRSVADNLKTWITFAETFSRPQHFDKTSVSTASINPTRINGVLGFFNSVLNASISFNLPASHNAVKVLFANAAQTGNVVVSVCRTRKTVYTCTERASTNAISFDNVEFSTRYAFGDLLIVHENGGAIGQNLVFKLEKISRFLPANTSKNDPVKIFIPRDNTIATVPGRAQLAMLANRDLPPVFTITGTMYGRFIGTDIPNLVASKLRDDIYVFWARQGHIKMTSVTLDAAQTSSAPVSLDDRYTISQSAPTPSTVQMLQDMWDGTFPNFPTFQLPPQDMNVYEVKNVRVLCNGMCRSNFNILDGPDGRGAVPFDRTLSQFLDAGAHTFNIATNGGFTAVAVVRFAGIAGSFERIFDLGNGARAKNIVMGRDGISTSLFVTILDDGVADCTAQLPNVIIQNNWITVIAGYRSSDQTLEVRVGSDYVSTVCSTARLDRVFYNTFVGRSNRPSDAYFSGSIAGIYLVDQLLSEARIWRIVDAMFRGIDVLQDNHSDDAYADMNVTAVISDGIQLNFSETDTDCVAK